MADYVLVAIGVYDVHVALKLCIFFWAWSRIRTPMKRYVLLSVAEKCAEIAKLRKLHRLYFAFILNPLRWRLR